MSTNNNGSPDVTAQTTAEVTISSIKRRFAHWPGLVTGILLIVVMFYLLVVTGVIGVLYAIVFPPPPPVPDNVTELSHVSEAYGVDEWIYGTSQSACEMVQFYMQQGTCRVSPLGCMPPDVAYPSSGDFVATCSSEIDFSIFAMRWRVDISTGYQEGPPTHLRLKREVFWTGEVPRVPSDFNLPESGNLGDN